MIEHVRFDRKHVEEITDVEPGKFLSLAEEQLKFLEESPWMVTVKYNGKVIMCGGIIDIWPGRAEAWAVLDKSCQANPASVRGILRVAQRLLSEHPANRIEATVRSDGFEEGHRFIYRLGFKLEAPRMLKYHPSGQDCALYARVR